MLASASSLRLHEVCGWRAMSDGNAVEELELLFSYVARYHPPALRYILQFDFLQEVKDTF